MTAGSLFASYRRRQPPSVDVNCAFAARLVFLASALFGAGNAAAGPAEAAFLARAVCGNCHGVDGNSVLPQYPKLAGLQSAYIGKQLREFIAGTRAHELMGPVVSKLVPDEISDLATYSSTQTPAPGKPGDAKLAARGRMVYSQGNPATGLPSCDGCHGPTGTGSPRFPRLAGQHQAYLYKQLNDIRKGRRNSSPLMRAVSERMSDEEMTAVTTYLSGL